MSGQGMEQEWTMSHGLPGLVDAPIQCHGDQDSRPDFHVEDLLCFRAIS